MINADVVTNIIQDEINKSTDMSVTKVLSSIKSQIVNLEENELKNMFEDYMQREIAAADVNRRTKKKAEEKLLRELF
jgi:hypothetical protein